MLKTLSNPYPQHVIWASTMVIILNQVLYFLLSFCFPETEIPRNFFGFFTIRGYFLGISIFKQSNWIATEKNKMK